MHLRMKRRNTAKTRRYQQPKLKLTSDRRHLRTTTPQIACQAGTGEIWSENNLRKFCSLQILATIPAETKSFSASEYHISKKEAARDAFFLLFSHQRKAFALPFSPTSFRYTAGNKKHKTDPVPSTHVSAMTPLTTIGATAVVYFSVPRYSPTVVLCTFLHPCQNMALEKVKSLIYFSLTIPKNKHLPYTEPTLRPGPCLCP